MSKTIDYYHFLISPWSYFAIGRFNELRKKHDVDVNYKPIDVMQTFDNMGGLPPAKRHPSRQDIRMQELKRWANYLGVPINFTPAHFPTNQAMGAKMVYAANGATGNPQAADFSDALLRACWAEEKDIADEATLVDVANACGLKGVALLEQAKEEVFAQQLQLITDEAHGKQVFGSPTYVVGDEIFWGQDRIDFLERHLET